MGPGPRGDDVGIRRCAPGSLRPSVPFGDDKQDPALCPERVQRRESDQWDAQEFAIRNGALLSIVDWPRPAVLQERIPSITLLECHMIALGCMGGWMCNNYY